MPAHWAQKSASRELHLAPVFVTLDCSSKYYAYGCRSDDGNNDDDNDADIDDVVDDVGAGDDGGANGGNGDEEDGDNSDGNVRAARARARVRCCWGIAPQKLMKSHWCVPFTATFSKRRKIDATWSEHCDATISVAECLVSDENVVDHNNNTDDTDDTDDSNDADYNNNNNNNDTNDDDNKNNSSHAQAKMHCVLELL